jgi:hypothetical protein
MTCANTFFYRIHTRSRHSTMTDVVFHQVRTKINKSDNNFFLIIQITASFDNSKHLVRMEIFFSQIY